MHKRSKVFFPLPVNAIYYLGGGERVPGSHFYFQNFYHRGTVNQSLKMDLKGSNAKIFTTREYSKCNLLTGVGSVVGELQVNDSIKYMQIKGLPILGEKGKEFIFTNPHHSPLPAAERTRDLFF